ncbi:MAG: sugar ABC transporter permease [Candidatus Dormibacteraeota bacterium]|nr:sugar ABC transporter permease [Candidatus Dormibacteraeota bacterium]
MQVVNPTNAVNEARAAGFRRALRKHGPSYLFILPNYLGVLVFLVFPVLFAFYLSFQSWNGLTRPVFVGLQNFEGLLRDSVFWLTLRNTAVYTLLTVPTGVLISLGVAALLNQRVRGLTVFRTAMFIPVVTSALAVAVIWKWIFDYQNGLVNDLLTLLHVPQVPWLSDPFWAMIGVAIIGVWQNFGLTSIILLAALQQVPSQLLEAASIDGAGPWRRFRAITVPLITPAIVFVSITSFISSFQVFAQVYYMTNGGPNYGTTVMTLLIFQRAFQQNRFGEASALAYILFAIIFLVTMAQLRLSRGAVNSASEFET